MAEITLASAASSAIAVAVTRKDGKVFTGTPVDLGDGLYKIATGTRGRPAVLGEDAIEKIAFVA